MKIKIKGEKYEDMDPALQSILRGNKRAGLSEKGITVCNNRHEFLKGLISEPFKVNYLVGYSGQFLQLLGEIESDERVCFIDRETQRVWMGEVKPDYILIRTVDTDSELKEIRERYCPLYSGIKENQNMGGKRIRFPG